MEVKHLDNLSIFTTGFEECEPKHSYSTAFSDRFLIHYIISGKGVFKVDGKTYSLGEGNAFLIGRDFGYYEADSSDPWTYAWINFSGEIAQRFIRNIGLSESEPIYKTKNPKIIADCFRDILGIGALGNDYLVYSRFFNLLGQMSETNEKKVVTETKLSDLYVERALEYIRSNYYRNIGVSDICEFVGLEYSYLFRLFKKKLNKSPGKYLAEYRLNEAERLLMGTRMTINEISKSAGYEDRIVFSKSFARKFGVSPANYRKNTDMNNFCGK